MTGKTHAMMGVSVGLGVVLGCRDISDIVLGVAFSTVGATISDIDIGSARIGTKTNRAIDVAIGGILIILLIQRYCFGLGLLDSYSAIIVGLAVCLWGKHQSHRGFMHSLIALVILSGCVKLTAPKYYLYFALGYVSHLLLDLLNKKGIQLFYPMEKRICFNFCSASGYFDRLLNKILFFIIAFELSVIFRVLFV